MRELFRRVFKKEPVAPPTPPVYSEIPTQNDDPNLYGATFKDQTYRFPRIGTLDEFRAWFDEYSQKGPECGSCGRLIFPNSNVGRLNQGKLTHLTDECSSGGSAAFIGTIGADGVLNPAFGGKNLLEHVFESGNEVFVTFGPQGPQIEETVPKRLT